MASEHESANDYHREMKRRCVDCGVVTPPDERCTNGRCFVCHVKHCTPGGATEPRHGRGQTKRKP